MVVIKTMKAAVSKLTQLGMSAYEAKAYTSLLKEYPLTAYEISKNSGVPTSKIYEVIKKLENRQMVQAIHSERTRMFIPVSPDEFINNYKLAVEESLNNVKKELKDIKTGMDTSYTWHIRDYDNLVLKARRMLETARISVLLSIWPHEMDVLLDPLKKAEERGIKIAVIHYGPTNLHVGSLYIHPTEDTIHKERKMRGFILVADSNEALNGKIHKESAEAIWSMNEGFVILAEGYIRHDIYQMKTIKRFGPLLKERFGERFEKMRDIFSDEEL